MIPFAAFTFRQVTAGRNAGIWVIGAIIIIIFPVHLKLLQLKKCIIKLPTLTRLFSLSDGVYSDSTGSIFCIQSPHRIFTTFVARTL